MPTGTAIANRDVATFFSPVLIRMARQRVRALLETYTGDVSVATQRHTVRLGDYRAKIDYWLAVAYAARKGTRVDIPDHDKYMLCDEGDVSRYETVSLGAIHAYALENIAFYGRHLMAGKIALYILARIPNDADAIRQMIYMRSITNALTA